LALSFVPVVLEFLRTGFARKGDPTELFFEQAKPGKIGSEKDYLRAGSDHFLKN
jgi:hypothetical protein